MQKNTTPTDNVEKKDLTVEQLFMRFCRDYIYSLRDNGFDISEQKRVELEQKGKEFLTQAKAERDEAWEQAIKYNLDWNDESWKRVQGALQALTDPHQNNE